MTYPNSPGFKAMDTAEAAADAMASKAPTLRERVLEEVRKSPGTPEAIAERLGEPVHNIRPRTSELHALGLIEDSGLRGTAMGGRKAIVWRAAPPPGGFDLFSLAGVSVAA